MSNYSGAVCKKCGAKMVINPKTGKEFCEKKCWLEGGESKTFQKSYDMIKDSKIEGMYNEKKENIKWLNALNNATLLIAHGIVKPVGTSIFDTITAMAYKYYKSEPPKEIKKKEELPIIETDDLGEEIDVKDFPF